MFSISKWAAQTFLAPKTEVKDEAPEMIDLTGDVDSPGAGGSSRDVRSNGGDGATTAGADAGANGWTKMMDVTSSAIVWTKTEPPGDAPSTAEEVKSEVKSEAVADSDVEKYAKFYAPRGRVPNPNAERFASARRAAARVDKVRAPIPVSGDEWGAKLPVTNIQDGTVTPGTFEGAIFEPGRVPSFTGVTLGASKPRGVLSSYDQVLIEGLDPGMETDGEEAAETRFGAGNYPQVNPLANKIDLRDGRHTHQSLCRLASESVPYGQTGSDTVLPEKARAMIPLVRAMLPGDATTDASILTARASDDYKRQDQLARRMEKRAGTGSFARTPGRGGRGGRGGGRGGRGRGRPRKVSLDAVYGAEQKRRRVGGTSDAGAGADGHAGAVIDLSGGSISDDDIEGEDDGLGDDGDDDGLGDDEDDAAFIVDDDEDDEDGFDDDLENESSLDADFRI